MAVACVLLVWSCDFRKLQLYMGQKLEQVVLGLCRAASCVEKKGHRPGQKAWSSGLRERPASHLVQGRSILHGLHGFKCSWLWRAWVMERGVGRSSCHADDVAAASKPAMATGDVIEPDAVSAGFLGDAWGSEQRHGVLLKWGSPGSMGDDSDVGVYAGAAAWRWSWTCEAALHVCMQGHTGKGRKEQVGRSGATPSRGKGRKNIRLGAAATCCGPCVLGLCWADLQPVCAGMLGPRFGLQFG